MNKPMDNPIGLRPDPPPTWRPALLHAAGATLWWAGTAIVTLFVVVAAGSWSGGDVLPEDVRAAHHGQRC